MALSWSQKRKLYYFLGVFFIIILPVALFIGINRYEAPTCFDGEENQGEAGVDCGGPCEITCAVGNDDLKVEWDRALRVSDGVYNVAARVNNTRAGSGIENVMYTVRLYNDENDVIATREGSTYIGPDESFVVFEPRLETGSDIPVRAFLEFEPSPTWIRTSEVVPDVEVVSRRLTGEDNEPRLQATLANNEFDEVQNVDVIVVVYDVDGNAVGASSTYVPSFAPTSQEQVYFTWPEPFDGEVSQIEVIPRINVF